MPIKLSYGATDNLTPDAEVQFQVQGRTNTGGVWRAWTTVSPWTKRRTRYPYLVPGLHQFRVQAKDQAGNVTLYKQGAVFTVAEHQESASSVTYSSTPGWLVSTSSGSYKGVVKKSPTTGAVTTFTFTGRDIAWVSTKGSNRGKAEVYEILSDGTKLKLYVVDLYSGTLSTANVVYAKGWSTSTVRTIEIRVSGTKNASSTGTRVDVDAFIVLNT